MLCINPCNDYHRLKTGTNTKSRLQQISSEISATDHVDSWPSVGLEQSIWGFGLASHRYYRVLLGQNAAYERTIALLWRYIIVCAQSSELPVGDIVVVLLPAEIMIILVTHITSTV